MEDSDPSDHNDSGSDEDPDLAMVLALLLRSGQVRLMHDNPNDNVDVMSESENNALEEPDTIKESDLYQDLLISLGKLPGLTNFTCTSINNNVAKSLQNREINCCGLNLKQNYTAGYCTSITANFIPNVVENVMRFREKLFCGTYSQDGNIFLSACQDGHLRVYKSHKLKENAMPFKDIQAKDIGWSILDTAFSPDSLYVAYSTWSDDIHVASIYDGGDEGLMSDVALDLKPLQQNFAVFSLQFSADGNEILCGSNDGHLYIYDRTLNERTSRIDAHEDDINAVCFADQSSQILYSGGDDGIVNVWDRRTLSESNPQNVGALAGHIDGITFIDSRLDGRFLLSNSKDQTIKVWDLRKFSSTAAQEAVRRAVSRQSWDYRWQQEPRRCRSRKKTVPGDTSLKTLHGHTVLNTLIRARFSPLYTTGQKYIYCGCSSGNVVVYDILTGEIVSKKKEHKHCVRDVSWHPYEPNMVSSSWDGTFSLWSYQDNEEESTKKEKCKKRKWVKRDFHDDDEETGESRNCPLRRSPRLSRISL